ncbi:MAG: RND family efflux transporter MFP subunit [Planctomycetota bacterium]|nr:MAG: RND family efflux transporter MFP subunit [Planctomycetota bacterium]
MGVAKTKLDVLERFSKLKMLTQLKADIQTDRAKLDARQKTWQLDKKRLTEIEEQIAKCIIRAPAAGQVVYANDANRGKTTGELLIAEGMPVRERQILVRLPDPSRMRVLAKVHESRISQVHKGLTAEVTTDALPDHPLTGTVSVVSEYPIPSANIYTSHIKEYAVEIEIHNPPQELRPGMSAQVDVLVEQQDSQLQIPIDAAIARGDKFFVAIPHEDGTFETREIKVGSANDAIITIREGLEVGQKVILNHSEIKDRLNLPELKLTVPPPAEPIATKPDAAKTDTANVKPVTSNAAKKS